MTKELFPVRVTQGEIFKKLTKEGVLDGDADKMALEISRKIELGLTIGSALDAEFSSSGVIIYGLSRFHFRLGQEFKRSLVEMSLTRLFFEVERLAAIGSDGPFSEVIKAVNEARYRETIAPDGEVWSDGSD